MDGYVSYALYTATVLGALALWMSMPRSRRTTPAWLGGVLGAATLGALWLWLARQLPDLGDNAAPFAYYYIFSAISIGAAVRVITHTKPVYAALWFVMVVLAGAGLLLTLAAEFIAFAMVIIYGGAILVTYVFVIMLASKSGDPESEQATPIYERQAREPLAAIAAGFVLLATLLSVAFGPLQGNERAAAEPDWKLAAELLPERSSDRMVSRIAEREDLSPRQKAELLASMGSGDLKEVITAVDEAEPLTEAQRSALLAGLAASRKPEAIEQLADEANLTPAQRTALGDAMAGATRLRNSEHVGLELFSAYPLGLELAGVVLLVSLVGAVVLARMRVTVDPDAEPGL